MLVSFALGALGAYFTFLRTFFGYLLCFLSVDLPYDLGKFCFLEPTPVIPVAELNGEATACPLPFTRSNYEVLAIA